MRDLYDAIERNKKPVGTLEIPADFNCYYLNKNSRPLSKIAKEFVRELADDSIKFISSLVK